MLNRDDLVKKLNITNVDELEQDRILGNLANIINDRIIAEVSDKLSDEDLNKLNSLIDEGKDNEIEWYIKSKFEHYEDFALKVEEDVINEIVQLNQQLGDKIDEVKASSATTS